MAKGKGFNTRAKHIKSDGKLLQTRKDRRMKQKKDFEQRHQLDRMFK